MKKLTPEDRINWNTTNVIDEETIKNVFKDSKTVHIEDYYLIDILNLLKV